MLQQQTTVIKSWMKQMLKDIGIKFEEPIIIYCDNTSIVSMSKNLILYSKNKHVSIKSCAKRGSSKKSYQIGV